MADEPPRAGHPPSDPLPGWPSPPAPPVGSTGSRPPWAEPPAGDPPSGARAPWDRGAPGPIQPANRAGSGPSRLGGRRVLVVVGAVLALLVVAATVALVTSGDDGAEPAAGGKDISLLAGLVVVTARPGWEQLESSADTASLRLDLRDGSGRELLSTLVLTNLPGGGSLDRTLSVDGGTPFEVPAKGGAIRATAVPGAAARVVAGTVRPGGTFFLSLSIFAIDGQGLEADTLRTLFTDQVAPALRFP